jgi:hypothetical protein
MIAALLLACGVGGSPVLTGEWASDYIIPDGRYSEFGWAGEPSDSPMMLLAEGDEWSLRNGQTWNTATEHGPFTVSTEDGLWLDEIRLLPYEVVIGTEQDGMEVTNRGEHTVYYGTFLQTVTVEIAEGNFAGVQVLAVGHGPIVLTWQDVTWELVYYGD